MGTAIVGADPAQHHTYRKAIVTDRHGIEHALTWITPDDPWAHRRYYLDGAAAVTIQQADGRRWRCSPNHPRGRVGACSSVPVGEHVEGCGWVAGRAEWSVFPARVWTSGRHATNRVDAYRVAGDDLRNLYGVEVPADALT